MVFSEFELKAMGFKFKKGSAFESVNCVGSSEEEMNAKVITKSCRGVVTKKVVKGDGTGTLKITAHIPYEVYVQAYGMELDTLIEGVKAYGQNSRHEAFSVVQDVFDEDGNEKFKAYPNCILESGVTRKIENGAEEVAEIEMEISIMPDEFGNGMYEALAEGLETTVANKWMSGFEPSMVQVTSA